MAGLAVKGVGMLFGHQNDDTNQPAQDAPAANDLGTPPEPQIQTIDAPGVNPLAVDPVTGASLPAVADGADDTTTAQTVEPNIQPTEEIVPDLPAPEVEMPTEPEAAPLLSTPEPEAVAETEPVTTANDDLLGLKQQALSQLSPLVSHLEQSPEEKFRTTMMLIQSTDDQSLLQTAYEAAQAISDDKIRAQALLDVVNEINYFTQQKAN